MEPKGTVGRTLKRTTKHFYTQNMKALDLCGFGEEDFL